MTMKSLVRTFISWVPLAIAIVGVCVLVYAAVQQDYRQSLNDPQIQMAEDAAAAINTGADPKTVVPPTSVDISMSLAPWIAAYGEDGTPIASSGFLFNAKGLPTPPAGVFAAAHSFEANQNGSPLGEDRVTWEPAPGIRQAIVVISEKSGYIVAGRGMREVEDREAALEQIAGAAALVLLVVTFIAKAFSDVILKRWS
jgi:hypothetical protein